MIRILYAENFLSFEECDAFIKEALPKLERSKVANSDKGKGKSSLDRIDNVRTSSGAWIKKTSSSSHVVSSLFSSTF
jgi:hypothetical protein